VDAGSVKLLRDLTQAPGLKRPHAGAQPCGKLAKGKRAGGAGRGDAKRARPDDSGQLGAPALVADAGAGPEAPAGRAALPARGMGAPSPSGFPFQPIDPSSLPAGGGAPDGRAGEAGADAAAHAGGAGEGWFEPVRPAARGTRRKEARSGGGAGGGVGGAPGWLGGGGQGGSPSGLSGAPSDASAAGHLGGNGLRWLPGMSLDAAGVVVGAPGVGSDARWSDGVAVCALGDFLSARANAAGLSAPLAVRVLSCEAATTLVSEASLGEPDAQPPLAPWDAGPEDLGALLDNAEGAAARPAVAVPFLRKLVAAFHNINGADALVFAMYVHEYPHTAPPRYAARALVEALDSPPVWPGLSGNERQRALTAILHGYFAFVASRGFRFMCDASPSPSPSLSLSLFLPLSFSLSFSLSLGAIVSLLVLVALMRARAAAVARSHLRVPPPDDAEHFIFARRTVLFRLRLNLHLETWFATPPPSLLPPFRPAHPPTVPTRARAGGQVRARAGGRKGARAGDGAPPVVLPSASPHLTDLSAPGDARASAAPRNSLSATL